MSSQTTYRISGVPSVADALIARQLELQIEREKTWSTLNDDEIKKSMKVSYYRHKQKKTLQEVFGSFNIPPRSYTRFKWDEQYLSAYNELAKLVYAARKEGHKLITIGAFIGRSIAGAKRLQELGKRLSAQ